MTLEVFMNSNVVYLGLATLASFTYALYTTFIVIFSVSGLLVRWHYNSCKYDINCYKVVGQLTALWTLFAILRFFLTLVMS